jgi:3-isopropylmalate/(R)-2-methylmalate dehydratase small subunit
MTLGNLAGRVSFVFEEDNFDIDQIVGVKYIKVQDLEELKNVAMKSYDPQFMRQVKPGDILVGGRNFGYGHPHYPPMRFMRHVGVSAVIAESFAPLYF